MKKFIMILMVLSMIFTITGCNGRKKYLFLPEAKNDKVYTTIGGEYETHQGEGYTLTVPTKNYRYEKDYDGGNLEEKWEYIIKDDIEIKVTTYKNSDEISARGKFLRDNEDYIFEDLMGYPVCGMELDGDMLWFNLHEADGNVYIISWEYPKNTHDDVKKELAAIAESFTVVKAE